MLVYLFCLVLVKLYYPFNSFHMLTWKYSLFVYSIINVICAINIEYFFRFRENKSRLIQLVCEKGAAVFMTKISVGRAVNGESMEAVEVDLRQSNKYFKCKLVLSAWTYINIYANMCVYLALRIPRAEI